jgi:hypothetical protein
LARGLLLSRNSFTNLMRARVPCRVRRWPMDSIRDDVAQLSKLAAISRILAGPSVALPQSQSMRMCKVNRGTLKSILLCNSLQSLVLTEMKKAAHAAPERRKK